MSLSVWTITANIELISMTNGSLSRLANWEIWLVWLCKFPFVPFCSESNWMVKIVRRCSWIRVYRSKPISAFKPLSGYSQSDYQYEEKGVEAYTELDMKRSIELESSERQYVYLSTSSRPTAVWYDQRHLGFWPSCQSSRFFSISDVLKGT